MGVKGLKDEGGMGRVARTSLDVRDEQIPIPHFCIVLGQSRLVQTKIVLSES